MAYRDFTESFLKKRGPIKNHIVDLSSPPIWFTWHDQCLEEFQHLQKLIFETKKEHQKVFKEHALRFSMDEDDDDETTVETSPIMKKIKDIKKLVDSINQFEGTFVKNIVKRFSMMLADVIYDFEKDRKSHVKHMQSATTASSSSEEEENYQDHQLIQKANFNEQLVMEREKDIQKIETMVNELSTLMRDLSLLVIDQGTIIDRIDFNVESAKEDVSRGLEQLQKANHYQNKTNYQLCIIILCLLITMMASLIGFKSLLY